LPITGARTLWPSAALASALVTTLHDVGVAAAGWAVAVDEADGAGDDPVEACPAGCPEPEPQAASVSAAAGTATKAPNRFIERLFLMLAHITRRYAR
jgi:hypothetical protein